MKQYQFRCIKDVFMTPSGVQAFVEGKIYHGVKSHYNYYYFQNEYNDLFEHQVYGEWLKEHFTPLTFTFGR